MRIRSTIRAVVPLGPPARPTHKFLCDNSRQFDEPVVSAVAVTEDGPFPRHGQDGLSAVFVRDMDKCVVVITWFHVVHSNDEGSSLPATFGMRSVTTRRRNAISVVRQCRRFRLALFPPYSTSKSSVIAFPHTISRWVSSDVRRGRVRR